MSVVVSIIVVFVLIVGDIVGIVDTVGRSATLRWDCSPCMRCWILLSIVAIFAIAKLLYDRISASLPVGIEILDCWRSVASLLLASSQYRALVV